MSLRASAGVACAAALIMATPAIADIPCPGDVNGDGKVTQLDLDLVNAAFGTDGSGVPGSDLNGDGIVDAADLVIVLSNFGRDCCPGDVNFDGIVDGTDQVLVLSDFGSAGTFPGTDINNDGIVDGDDLAIVLENFGANCHD
jgi:hypothetical protein